MQRHCYRTSTDTATGSGNATDTTTDTAIGLLQAMLQTLAGVDTRAKA